MDRLDNPPAPRVLVYDSDRRDLARHAHMLLAAGLRVDTANTLEAARAKLQSTRRYAAVVGAADLIDDSTASMVAAIHRRDPTLPLLVLAGSPSVERVLAAMEAGACSYLSKPVEGGRLVREVLTAAESRRGAGRRRPLAAHFAHRSARYVHSDLRVRPAIDEALENTWLAGQPIVEPTTGEVHGYELFLRSDSTLLATPAMLVAACRHTGRIGELGHVVRALAVEELELLPQHVRAYVNVDPAELVDDLIHRDDDPLHALAGRVTLNVTDRTRVGPEHASRLQSLRERGYSVALDQLGSGYGGLNSLIALRPDVLKLDGTLVRGVSADPTRVALVDTLVKLCRTLHITLIAEGVECGEDARRLESIGVGLLQGYYIGRPAPLHPRRELP